MCELVHRVTTPAESGESLIDGQAFVKILNELYFVDYLSLSHNQSVNVKELAGLYWVQANLGKGDA